MKCDCFREECGKTVCYGTKEREVCTCDGNENECNFYKSKRKTDKFNLTSSERAIFQNKVIDCLNYKEDVFRALERIREKMIEQLGITESQYLMDKSENDAYCSLSFYDVETILAEELLK